MNPQNSLTYSPNNNMVKSHSSLGIIYNLASDYSLTAGNNFSLRVTISNQGVRSALINVYIDETSRPLWEWCEQPFQQLALSVGESSEVVFPFKIPLTAIADIYEYIVIVDAPKHYPQETPITHKASIKVLSPVESSIPIKDPTFVLSPESNSRQPVAVSAGKVVEIQALVFNNTDRVDRFRLRCLDLPSSWIEKIIYPEGVEELGLVVARKNLALNPGTKGKITVRLALPINLDAGDYSATMQLYSENNPDLVLLNLFYFQVVPIYKLNFQLNALINRVSNEAGVYKVVIENQGNTKREIITQVTTLRANNLCKFSIEPVKIKLQPQQTQSTQLQVKPRQWWKRPLFGQGMTIDFNVNFIDAYKLPLPRATLKGQLIWEARPWWHLLLMILTGISLVATVIFLIWWFFFKPPAPPKINNFASDSPTYRAINNDFIHLNWEIDNAKQIRNITIVGRNPLGQIISRRQRYDFTDGIPEELTPYCNMNRILSCRNVVTDASRPGEYIFEIQVRPKVDRQVTVTQETSSIDIQPLPKPKIINVSAEVAPPSRLLPTTLERSNPSTENQTTISSANSLNNKKILLNFTIANWEQLQKITLTGRNDERVVNFPTQTYQFTEGIPDLLQPFCNNNLDAQQLICQNIPLNNISAGDYLFELEVTSKQSNQEPVDRAQTDKIKIAPPPIPQIVSINSTEPTYQESQEILLNWNIANSQNLGQIELIGRSPEGVVTVPAQTFNFAGGIPEQLKPYCQLGENFSCQFIPTNATEAGKYQFELTAKAKNDPLQQESLKSDVVLVKALPEIPIPKIEYPLKINAFTINNQPAPAKYIVTIDPRQPIPSLNIGWQVEGSPQAKVELLPSPGQVEKSGTITFPLSPRAGQETLTLRVKDEIGKTVTRSVIIDKVVLSPPESPVTPNELNNRGSGTNNNTGRRGNSFSGSQNNNNNNQTPNNLEPPKIPKIDLDRPERIVPSDLPPKL